MYKKWLVLLLFPVFGLFGWILWQNTQDKVAYELFISEQLANNLAQYSSYIVTNQHIYEEILKNKIVTPSQLKELSEQNSFIAGTTDKYLRLAFLLGDQRADRTGILTQNASIIGQYFHSLEKTEQERCVKKEGISLGDKELEHIALFSKLNQLWVKVIMEETSGVTEEKVTEDFFDSFDSKTVVRQRNWINLFLELDEVTSQFMTKIEGSPEHIGIILERP